MSVRGGFVEAEIGPLLRAEGKGLIEVTRPGVYRAEKERNLYRKVTE